MQSRAHWWLAVALLMPWPAMAQRNTGELRLSFTDPSGLGVTAAGELSSKSSGYHKDFTSTPEGRFVARNLPYGIYQLRVGSAGFQAETRTIEIRSEIPKELNIQLGLAPVGTSVVITDAATLLDPSATGTAYYVGSDTINARPSAPPGRDLIDLVQSQPGWLLEANGVLHPRGSEYQVQYVIDGIPVTDNRSPAFSPNLEAGDVQSMNVLTANYPAEYGRKLGGIVEVNEQRDSRPGFHGKAIVGGDTFHTEDGFLSGQYGWAHSALGLSVEGALTDRYLDPPVLDNYTNHANTGGGQARFDQDLGDKDRISVSARWARAGFLIPNELVQQVAGQRQDRSTGESEGHFTYERVLSPSLLLNVRGMGRDVSANLWSNPDSTPIQPQQQRSFRDWYGNANLSGHSGRHEWKAGVDAVFTSIEERFQYRISDPSYFDPGTPLAFAFHGRAQGREQSAYVQDVIRAGQLTFSLGLRWDHYHLLLNGRAFSPRLGVAWAVPHAGLVVRASYDRAFQTPAFENLLLASSAEVQALNGNVLRLPVPASRGNFYQVGVAKSLWSKMRLDVSFYRRAVRNMADDDVLLNTGVSFPISFARAKIQGVEAHLDLPRWGPLSGYVSYSNMTGFGWLPITGGLFLGDATSQLSGTERFPITQDQRNTVHGRMRYQPWKKLWFAADGSYGSGLPTELDNVDLGDLQAQYGQAILNRVNFTRGRVRPSFQLDFSTGVELWERERKTLRLQADVLNATDRLNVINFAGLFSGTAVAPPRSVALRLQFEF